MRGVGPLTAQVILVGEAPGKDEVYYREPFVGRAGQFQSQHGWAPVGLTRRDVRLENVCEAKLAGNKVESLVPSQAQWWQEHLYRRLDQLLGDLSAAGRVIVPVGNFALNTVLRQPLPIFRAGKKAGQWRLRQPGGIIWPVRIGQYRGSLLEYTSSTGLTCRVIPTVHPAAFLYADSQARFDTWQGDWRKIAGEVAAGCPPLEEGDDRIAESAADCASFYKTLDRFPCLALDLETQGELILCAGFAVSGEESFTIPLMDPDTMTPLKWGWFWLARILAHDIPKTTWNGLFDTFLLRWHKLPVHHWRWDGLAEHHLLDPGDRHTLGYCASRDLRTAFWKDEAKEAAEGERGGWKKVRADWEGFLRYCGKDARHTLALTDIYLKRLSKGNLVDIYVEHYRRVQWAALDLSLTGFCVDEVERERLHQDALHRLDSLRVEMAERAGMALTTGPRVLKSGLPSKAKHQPKGGLSNPKLLAYFYDHLRCAPYKKGGKRTANEVAIRRLCLKYPAKAAAVGELILAFRHWEKVAQFTASARLDRDGRIRSLFRPLTITGRLKSQIPPTKRGANLQNQPHKVRSMFVPSSGDHLLAELDLSQAESRIVDGSSGDRRALELARTLPTELDQHRLMASEVLGLRPEEVSPRDRNVVGKKGRHATNYGMGGKRMSEVLIVETESEVVLTPDECDHIITRIMEARPYIGSWQRWVRERILRDRKIVNSWGRFLKFPQYNISDEDYKEAYAWGPQGEVGVLLNQEGWVPCWSAIKRGKMVTRVVQQGHDAIVLDGPPGELWDLICSARERLTSEREYPGVKGPWTLRMPVGLKIGRRWGTGMTEEWKDAMQVTWEEFRHAAEGLLACESAS